MSIHDLNKTYADKGITLMRGRDGYDNYYMLGTFPEFGAVLAMRARNSSAGKKGTKVGFKLRITPIEGAEMGNWENSCPSIEWANSDHTRRSACFGIGIAAWTKAEVNQALIDVDYAQVLDNWITALGLTWDTKQRELLPAYLAEAENALFEDDFGEGVAPVEVEGRVAHAARKIVPEEEIWYGEEYQAVGDAGGNDNALLSGDDGDDEDTGDDEEEGDPFST